MALLTQTFSRRPQKHLHNYFHSLPAVLRKKLYLLTRESHLQHIDFFWFAYGLRPYHGYNSNRRASGRRELDPKRCECTYCNKRWSFGLCLWEVDESPQGYYETVPERCRACYGQNDLTSRWPDLITFKWKKYLKAIKSKWRFGTKLPLMGDWQTLFSCFEKWTHSGRLQ